MAESALRARSAFSLLLNDPAWMTSLCPCTLGFGALGMEPVDWGEGSAAAGGGSAAALVVAFQPCNPGSAGAASSCGAASCGAACFHGRVKFSGFSGGSVLLTANAPSFPFDDFPLAAN